ncbi:MAG: hypothetical protein HC767_09845 [Akkermansiaceae bacterium]|nr:hypothetical protein [Akkermansiaceae bacterium]
MGEEGGGRIMMETPVEYFYGETLRWSFGFENPNKAAVIFACAVPLLWCILQLSWRLRNRWLRISASLVSLCGLFRSLVMFDYDIFAWRNGRSSRGVALFIDLHIL